MKVESDHLLTTGQVAKYCGVNFRTVIRWIKKGYLHASRLPGARGDHRITMLDLIGFLKSNNMLIPVELRELESSSSTRILIVEDDLAMANSIQRILKLAGYETKIANGGFEAGVLLATFKPQVMTLDIHMIGMNGIDVLKLMKKNNELAKVKVLVISADNSGQVEESMKIGAHSFITKPFQREDLLNAIEHIKFD